MANATRSGSARAPCPALETVELDDLPPRHTIGDRCARHAVKHGCTCQHRRSLNLDGRHAKIIAGAWLEHSRSERHLRGSALSTAGIGL